MSEWDPDPVELRDGESEDLSGHAQSNIEMIRWCQESGQIDSDEAADAIERIKEKDTDF